MSLPLSPDRIRDLYAAYLQPGDGAWLRHSRAVVDWVAHADPDELRTRESQVGLWGARGFGSLGSSENLHIDAILDTPAIAEALVALRDAPLPDDTSERATELQARHDAIAHQVRGVVTGHMPRARLVRCIALLRLSDGHAGLSDRSHRAVRRLLTNVRGLAQVEAAVLARARLRDALGEEDSLTEHVRRGQFCWWLYENIDTIVKGHIPAAPIAPVDDHDDDPLPMLELWAPERQNRWLQSFKGGLATLRMPLRECLESRAFDDLQVAVADELGAPFGGTKYLRVMLRALRHLGLMEESQGRWRTTDDGEDTLDSDPPDALIEALLVRVAGVAFLLKTLTDTSHSVVQLKAALSAYEGGHEQKARVQWALSWLRTGGLVDRDGSGWEATALGHVWAARIPDLADRLPDTPIEEEELEATLVGPSNGHPTFEEIWQRFETDPELAEFVFTRAQVRALHTSWTFHPRKRFTILSGLSGTGKTQILRHYARIVCTHMGLDPAVHIALVPVRPDWRDPTGLLGYFNALHAEPTFQVEPALRLLLRATRHPNLPWFLLLDEMNLARVERYFAPFLSAMETGEALHLHAEEEPVHEVPATVPWPASLRIGGTVNMDETTHPFSDKVLDRAFTMEFWDVDLKTFFERHADRSDYAMEVLTDLQAELVKIRRHVGYRTAGEVLAWCDAAMDADRHAPHEEVLDQAIYAKVLPRLRGAESEELLAAFDAMIQHCTRHELPMCAGKLRSMRRRLIDTGIAGFWS